MVYMWRSFSGALVQTDRRGGAEGDEYLAPELADEITRPTADDLGADCPLPSRRVRVPPNLSRWDFCHSSLCEPIPDTCDLGRGMSATVQGWLTAVEHERRPGLGEESAQRGGCVSEVVARSAGEVCLVGEAEVGGECAEVGFAGLQSVECVGHADPVAVSGQ
jgi:hypothetical protein